MKTKILKWGNSLGLRIPKAFAVEARMKEGSPVDLTLEDGKLVVRPARDRDLDLQALVNAITPGNLHGEIDTGTPSGKEVW
jgi:antitoxin MazE